MMLQASLAVLLLSVVNTAPPVCGDGVVSPGEACDDGGTGAGDGCGADCNIEAGYSCYGAPSLCSAGCGNGALGEGEQCDDGNSASGDGCGSHCGIEPGYGCTGFPSVCTVACGDGILAATEACDDGNTAGGDGCSAACAIEPGFSCPTAPVSAFFTRRGNSDCTTVGSITAPVLPTTVAQAVLSTPGRYRVRYVSGAISYYAGGAWLPGVLGVNFTGASGTAIFSLGVNPPGGRPSREPAMGDGFSLGLKRDFEAVSGPVLLGMVDTDCADQNNSNTTIIYRVDALAICQQEPVISQVPAVNGPGTFAGTAAAGKTVAVSLDGATTPVCTAVANPSGAWTCTASTLAEGAHSAVATVTLLGATASSAPAAFLRDTIAPAAPSITTPTQGAVVNAVPELGGLAEPGSQVTVAEDALLLCTALTSASGSWSCTPSLPLASGPHTVLATATDVAANSSSPSVWRAFSVDAKAPAAPVLTKPVPGQVVAANPPRVEGIAQPGALVRVQLDGMAAPVCTVVAALDGSWSCTVSAPLPQGEHQLTATATDAVGNTGPDTLATSFTVDTQAPDTFITSGPPALVLGVEADFAFSSDEEGVAYECSLDEDRFAPCVTHYTLAPGAHVLRVRAVDAAGNVDLSPAEAQWTLKLPHLAGGGCSAAPLPAVWLALLTMAALRPRTRPRSLVSLAGLAALSLLPAPVLAQGAHSAVATVTLLSATESSASVGFVWNTVAPAAPVLTLPMQGTDVPTTPAFGGVSEPGSQVTVAEDSLVLCTATASASGDWSCTPSQPLGPGPHTVVATATDTAANSSPPSAWRAFTVDVEAPAAPALWEPQPQAALATATPNLRGLAEPSSTVQVYMDGGPAPVCMAMAEEDGSWSCPVSSLLAEGAHTLTATATDSAGNTSPDTGSTSFTVDTQAPDTSITRAPPALDLAGSTEFEFASNEAEVNYECALDTERFTPCPVTYSLAPGTHVLRVRAVDAAGNTDPSPAEHGWTVRLPHLAGGGCSAAPLPAVWLALLGLAALCGARRSAESTD